MSYVIVDRLMIFILAYTPDTFYYLLVPQSTIKNVVLYVLPNRTETIIHLLNLGYCAPTNLARPKLTQDPKAYDDIRNISYIDRAPVDFVMQRVAKVWLFIHKFSDKCPPSDLSFHGEKVHHKRCERKWNHNQI